MKLNRYLLKSHFLQVSSLSPLSLSSSHSPIHYPNSSRRSLFRLEGWLFKLSPTRFFHSLLFDFGEQIRNVIKSHYLCVVCFKSWHFYGFLSYICFGLCLIVVVFLLSHSSLFLPFFLHFFSFLPFHFPPPPPSSSSTAFLPALDLWEESRVQFDRDREGRGGEPSGWKRSQYRCLRV